MKVLLQVAHCGLFPGSTQKIEVDIAERSGMEMFVEVEESNNHKISKFCELE